MSNTNETAAIMERMWSSPTLMTWLNIAARLLSLLVVLPLVLRQFSAADVALYYLFASMIALQLMAGSGFVPTFARFISYALAGATQKDIEQLRTGKLDRTLRGQADPRVLAGMVATLGRVFAVLSAATVPVMAVIGTWLLLKPVSASPQPWEAWLAWAVVIAVTPLSLYSAKYSAVLQGANKVVLEQRWSALFVIFGSASGIAVLLAGGGLFALVAVNQVWQVAAFFRLAWLTRVTLRSLPYEREGERYSPEIFRAVWPSSWKSFVGVVASGGITAASGLFFAQYLGSAKLAEFMLALRVMSAIAEVSRAPFYSKLPVLNGLRASNDQVALERLALRGMRLSYAAFVVLFLCAPLALVFALPLIKSNVAFPDLGFWCLLGAAVLVERVGAMHVQLYSTTNDIIWHWLNGVTGCIWITLILILRPSLGYWAYPVGMLLAYSSFYTLIAMRRSLASIGSGFWRFERACFVPAAGAFLGTAGLLIALRSVLLPPA